MTDMVIRSIGDRRTGGGSCSVCSTRRPSPAEELFRLLPMARPCDDRRLIGGSRETDPLVVAEAVKFDTGDVVLVLLGLLSWLLTSAFVLGGIGVLLGFRLGRSTLPAGAAAHLPRRLLAGRREVASRSAGGRG